MMAVVYKPIAGYPGYRVGDDGSVWSCWRVMGMGMGQGSRSVLTKVWHKLNPGRDDDGYQQVSLTRDRKQKTTKVHILVITEFVGPKPKGMQCRHKDGNLNNNRATNLIWGTAKENKADSIAHGTIAIGTRVASAVLTPELVRQLRKDRDAGYTYQQLGDKYDISKVNARYVYIRRTWKHIK